MKNFVAFNPTKLHFGKGVVGDLGTQAFKLGKSALLMYGGGSVLKNGSYLDTLNQLKKFNISIVEFSGIRPNPLAEDVNSAARLGRAEKVDMVVAVGGGSVIDSAKITAICIADGCSAWEVMSRKHKPSAALPLISVLTLAATGTEMNAAAVLQNRETRQKIGFRTNFNYPKHSFLDPSYTLSVPENYTSWGIVDLISHCLEAWFGEGKADLSDRFVVSIIREAMEYGPALLKDLDNYELRAKIMWAATCALNNTTMHGRSSGDWGVHALGHVLSFLYDTPHGASLSIMYPGWLKMMRLRAKDRILKIGAELFGATSVNGTIAELENLFSSLGSPITCNDAGIDSKEREVILELMNRNKSQGLHHSLSNSEREEVMNYVM